MSEPDFDVEAMRLVLAVRDGQTTEDRIKSARNALLAAYRDGARSGKKSERQRASQHGSVSHADWCNSEDCLGQCRVR